MKECFIGQAQDKERKVKNMTVKEFHEMCTGSKERYIDPKTETRFTLDYYEGVPSALFQENWRIYQDNKEKRVVSVWAMIDHDGHPVTVVVFQ